MRGEIWWASLADPSGSGPGYRRPALIIQADAFTRSAIAMVIVAVLSSNLRLSAAPGNVLLTARQSGLSRESVVDVSQLITLDRCFLTGRVGRVAAAKMREVDAGLMLVLALERRG